MPTAPERVQRPPRVLIVEDERRLRDLLAEVVPEMGFPARAVRSAEEALRTVENEPADILILDLQLPAMGGMELLARLRESYPDLQAIILTAFGDLPTAQSAIRLDVTDFLSKPCHLRDIELALDRARRRIEQIAFPAETAAGNSPETVSSAVPMTLAKMEYRQILAAIDRHAGNKTAAAEELGISRRTLHYRLAEYRARGNRAS